MLFTIDCDQGSFIFKIMLPLAPRSKTLSEVATLSFVRANTSIPVPRVVAFDADYSNELGFEWILMEGINSNHFPLQERWRELSWLQKELLVRKVADYVAQLSGLELSGIGSVFRYNLRSYTTGVPEDFDYLTGELISPRFFKDDRIQLCFHRGPYQTSSEYIAAHLEFLLHDIAALRASGDEEDQQQAIKAHEIFRKIELVVEKLFPSYAAEPTFLVPNFNKANIYVDAEGNLVGILDWSSVAAVPLWDACHTPNFLGRTKYNACPEPVVPFEEMVEDQLEWYNEKVDLYEEEQLRMFFVQEMRRIEPKWADSYENENLRGMCSLPLIGLTRRCSIPRSWAGYCACWRGGSRGGPWGMQLSIRFRGTRSVMRALGVSN